MIAFAWNCQYHSIKFSIFNIFLFDVFTSFQIVSFSSMFVFYSQLLSKCLKKSFQAIYKIKAPCMNSQKGEILQFLAQLCPFFNAFIVKILAHFF